MEAFSKSAATVLPDLEHEYADLLAELEREQAEVAEIEACDQAFLNELKGQIDEQK